MCHTPRRSAGGIRRCADGYEDYGVDSEIVEEGHEIRGLAAHVERAVAAAGNQDDGRAGIQATVDKMHFDRRVVDVDDAVDAPRHGAAHAVLLRDVDLVF